MDKISVLLTLENMKNLIVPLTVINGDKSKINKEDISKTLFNIDEAMRAVKEYEGCSSNNSYGVPGQITIDEYLGSLLSKQCNTVRKEHES